ncbi:uncharacterized protein [Rutidosis leptorrhynchoides]|uniref:uncharacterized protein n=1 Tax=Rutidosis leptorrhynchoides TaxID=125765 RepID=UPI003A993253
MHIRFQSEINRNENLTYCTIHPPPPDLPDPPPPTSELHKRLEDLRINNPELFKSEVAKMQQILAERRFKRDKFKIKMGINQDPQTQLNQDVPRTSVLNAQAPDETSPV